MPVEAKSQLVSPDSSQEAQKNCGTGERTFSSINGEHSPARSGAIHELLNPTDENVNDHSGSQTFEDPAKTLCTPPPSFDEASTTVECTVLDTENFTQQDHRLPKKRSHEEMKDGQTDAGASSNHMNDRQSGKLHRSSSFMRLAIGMDGSVKVRTGDETTPSPPKRRTPLPEQQIRRGSGLSRSQSAVEGIFNFQHANFPVKRAPGRSRDVRTWEFYCDKQARESLVSHAEEEGTGSAVGAINLIRSATQKKSPALNSNMAKHNTRLSQGEARSKPALARAQSSLARLQHNDENAKSKPRKAGRVRSGSGSDSDKENWAPGTTDSHNPLRRTYASAIRSTILQHTDPMTESSSRQALTSGRGLSEKGVSKGDDLDCVEGLLSLSQGAWK